MHSLSPPTPSTTPTPTPLTSLFLFSSVATNSLNSWVPGLRARCGSAAWPPGRELEVAGRETSRCQERSTLPRSSTFGRSSSERGSACRGQADLLRYDGPATTTFPLLFGFSHPCFFFFFCKFECFAPQRRSCPSSRYRTTRFRKDLDVASTSVPLPS